MNNKNIVLIGFMGCGKTTLGKELSKALNLGFVDIDCKISQNHSMSITDIFEKYGESYFRELEKNEVQEISQMNNMVISTGGGVVLHSANMKHLKKNGIIVYLKTSPLKIFENLKGLSDRPLLDKTHKLDKIAELLETRELLYNQYSNEIIDVSKNFDTCLEALVQKCEFLKGALGKHF